MKVDLTMYEAAKLSKIKNWQCTNCNMELPPKKVEIHDEIVWQYAGEMKYCPNCGAKLNKEAQNES